MFLSLHSQLTLSLPVLRCTDYMGREARNSLQNAGFQTPHLPSFIAARAHDHVARSSAEISCPISYVNLYRDIGE